MKKLLAKLAGTEGARWLKRLFCQHQWQRTYSYASMKDTFSGVQDKSGTIYLGEECKLCDKTRSCCRIYGKDGRLQQELIR